MSIRILVVDDEPDLELLIRQKFRRQIREGEYDFCFAHNGVEAFSALCADHNIDIVLTDINMPEMDGLTLLVKINELERVLKSVIISAYGDLDNIRTAMNRGAFDFLTKPIDFRDLEITIQKTTSLITELKHAMAEHEQLEAIHHELDVAREMQQAILPRKFSPFDGHPTIALHARMIPAKEVGGDFYDFFFINDDQMGIVIADVSGKGIPAAMFMMVSRTLLKAEAISGTAANECLAKVNNLLCEDNESSMFVTLFYGILNTRTGEMQFSNAGHNPPFVLRRAARRVEFIEKSGGMALGMFPDRKYTVRTMQFEPGDGLFLYTDGVTEADSVDNGFFLEERLRATLEKNQDAPARQLTEEVVREVKSFAAGAPQSDDITTLAVRYNA